MILALLLAASAATSPVENRCGWILNPTPANWWLRDKGGEWTLSVQGGFQHAGADLPDMSEKGWVATNGPSYGYGCACVKGVFDRRSRHVVTVQSARALPLAQCKRDKTLPKPD